MKAYIYFVNDHVAADDDLNFVFVSMLILEPLKSVLSTL